MQNVDRQVKPECRREEFPVTPLPRLFSLSLSSAESGADQVYAEDRAERLEKTPGAPEESRGPASRLIKSNQATAKRQIVVDR